MVTILPWKKYVRIRKSLESLLGFYLLEKSQHDLQYSYLCLRFWITCYFTTSH